MKYLILISFLALRGTLFAQVSDTIFWSPEYKLTWDDFQGKEDTSAPYQAITESGIKYSYHYDSSEFCFAVKAFFKKSMSWRIRNVSDYTLDHEQIHFDITEVFARKLKAEFLALVPKRENIKSDVKRIVSRVTSERNELQAQYDIETDFSNNKSKQAEWNCKIKKMLKKLDNHK